MEYVDLKQKYCQSYLAFKATPTLVSVIKSYTGSTVDEEMEWIPATGPQATSDAGSSIKFNCIIPLNGITSTQLLSVPLPYTSSMYDDPETLYSKVPVLGMINAPDNCYYIVSVPIQGQSRGYAPGNCVLHVLNYGAVKETGLDLITKNTPSIVVSIFNHKYTPYFQALMRLAQGDALGCALSQYLAVVLDHGKRFPLLYHRTECIGRVQEYIPHLRPGTPAAIVDYVRKITGIEPQFR